MNVRKTVAALVLLGVTGTASAAKQPQLPPAWDAKALENDLGVERWSISQRRNWANNGNPIQLAAARPGATLEILPGVGITVRGTATCVREGYGVTVAIPCEGRAASDGVAAVDPTTSIDLKMQVTRERGDPVTWTISAPLKTAAGTSSFEQTITLAEVASKLGNTPREALKTSLVQVSGATLPEGALPDSETYAKNVAGAMLDASPERVGDGWVVRGRLGSAPLEVVWPGAEVCGRHVGIEADDPAAKDRELSLLATTYAHQWDVGHLVGDKVALKAWRSWIMDIAKDNYAPQHLRWLREAVEGRKADLKDDDQIRTFAWLNYMTKASSSDHIRRLFTNIDAHLFSWNSLGKASSNVDLPGGWGFPGHHAVLAILDEQKSLKSPDSLKDAFMCARFNSEYQFVSSDLKYDDALLTEAGRRNMALPDVATCRMGNKITTRPGSGLPLTMKSPPVEVHVIDWPAGTLVGEVKTATVATSDVPVLTLFE